MQLHIIFEDRDKRSKHTQYLVGFFKLTGIVK